MLGVLARDVRQQLVDESRLPDAGLADEEHDLSAPGRSAAMALGHEPSSGRATDERRARALGRVGRRLASDLHRAAAGRPQDHRVANEARGGRAEHDGPGGRLRQ
jgi:hypothetical protein